MPLRCPSLLVPSVVLALSCGGNTIELETETETAEPGSSGSSTGGEDVVSVGPTADTSSTGVVDEGTSDPTDTTGQTTIDPREPLLMLLAIDTTVDPGLPFQGIVIATPGPASIDLTLQWLSLDQGSTTEPRELIGEVIEYPAIPLDPDGGFVWDAGELRIPGEANPITGTDVQLTARAEVRPQGEPYCGTVDGAVTFPIQVSLDGSTLAMTEVPSPTELPLRFPLSCF